MAALERELLPVASVLPEPKKKERIRLEYLDGLRGLAAIYVVLGHIYVALRFFSPDVVLPTMLLGGLSLFNIGQSAVDLFIVLSGYVLMLPVVRAGGELRGGFSHYIRRRALRILPPYYAAIVVALLISALMGATGLAAIDPNDFSAGSIIAHLLVIHNLHPVWVHTIDPPMWSVGMEWQIYFLFPLILLPVWRRFGIVVSVLVAFLIGYAPHFLFNGLLDWSFPWFIGLFALGMAAAFINFSPDLRAQAIRQHIPWGWLALVIGIGIFGFCLLERGWYSSHQWLADPLIGLSAMCLIIFCTRHLTDREEAPLPPALRLLSMDWVVWLGTFSYSIYLVHYPLMLLFWSLQMQFTMPPIARLALMYGLYFPLSIVAAYLFHVVFERWCMPGHLQARQVRLAKLSH